MIDREGGGFGSEAVSQLIERVAETLPLMVVDDPLFQGLTTEFGSPEAVLIWLAGLAARLGHPVGLHLLGMTTLLSPPGWSGERLQGWVAPHLETLQQAFGAIGQLLLPEERDDWGDGALREPQDDA